MRLATLLALSSLVCVSGIAGATSYTYTVNDHYAGFSVTGTITTDSDSGVLGTSDITGYNLVLNDGSSALTLDPGDSGVGVFGSDLVASSTALTYNFGDPSRDYFIIEDPSVGTGTNYLCYQGVGGGCDNFNGAHESIDIGADAVETDPRSGVSTIATMGTTSATPEPGSLLLFGSGLLGIAGIARRKLLA